ncbi:MAG: NupC/NupG family nucleoside CNT transporter [Planctomycetes bacterium]|nr:NupC/NupG family nucleoside CNT transporter [Planctomycetota bacterium]
MSVARGLMGVAVLVGFAWAMSFNRRKMPWKLVLTAVGMQVLLGLCLIKWDIGRNLFEDISQWFVTLLSFTEKGAGFVFGDTAKFTGEGKPALAFTALPTIIFFSCLMAVLYHLRVMHVLIWLVAKVMSRLLGVTGAESMAMAANIFVGQTEAPLVVRRFVPEMTKSELMSLMTGGFATVAGSVMAAYIYFLEQGGGQQLVPHLLIASVMSAPAAFAISKIIVPETEVSTTGRGMQLKFERSSSNVLDAAATGVSEGLKLWANVFAMLLAFIAMVALVDHLLGLLHDGWSLEWIFGRLFAPVAFLMGVERADVTGFGALLGTKICVNEFVAYLNLEQEVIHWRQGAVGAMSERSLFMATYALCGFANFASIGIQIGGIAPMAPERRGDIINLALRAMFGGALASWMTASIAGMFF